MMNIHYAPSPTVTTKNGITSKNFFTPLFCCCFWIQDPRCGFRDKHPGSATLYFSYRICSKITVVSYPRSVITINCGKELHLMQGPVMLDKGVI